MKNNNLIKLQKLLGEERVGENKDLFPYLTLRTKTRAEYFFEAKTKEDWQKAVKAAYDLKLPLFILGGGSNIAVTQEIVKGLVIKNLYLKKEKIAEDKNTVTYLVSSGYPTAKLVTETVEEGLEGLEYHKGLPGTIGGAIYMNSKWTKPLRYVSELVVSGLVVSRDGKLKNVDHDYFQFAYDFSVLHKNQEILIEVTMKFKKIPREILISRANEAISYRLRTQPKGTASCGCFFRNISAEDQKKAGLPTNSVGYLIDQLGLKNFSVGGFTISDIHGNFIVNKQGKESKITDLQKLLKIIKDKVRSKYGIELEEEVVLI